MKQLAQSIFLLSLISACSKNNNADQIARWKEEINITEKSFCKLAKEEGIHKAFLTYAAEDAVLMRNNAIISGRDKIDSYFQNMEELDDQELIWEPDFIDISSSGNMGYTYGNYVFSYKDSLGNIIESVGIFHTVWKRQLDGSWKFVWD